MHTPRSRSFLFSCLLLVVGASALAADPPGSPYKVGERLGSTPGKPASDFREVKWEELIPPNWNPADAFKGVDLAKMEDGDPRAMDALARMRDVWANAPVASSLNGAAVRIAGFVIPLERVKDEVSEFLLVPYFGACIHVPPPPANQIIHVVSDKPLKNVQTMDAMWVSGVLKVSAGESSWGRSAYRMQAKATAPYVFPARK